MHDGISNRARLLESERRSDFFKLMSETTAEVSPVEKKITMDCFDEINFRYADFTGLLAFTASYAVRNRAGGSFFARYRLPLYIGLVGYDCGLRAAAVAPSTTCWNSLCLLDSDLGRRAREMHTPHPFYEVKQSGNNLQRPKYYFSWLFESTLYIFQSLFLTKVISYTFEGSCRKQRIGDVEKTALVITNRFMRMNVFTLIHRKSKRQYNLYSDVLPKFYISPEWYYTRKCRNYVLRNCTTDAAYLWYWLHFKWFDTVLTSVNEKN